MSAAEDKQGGLSHTLRQGALAVGFHGETEWIVEAMREAADALESYEAAERERLEHEAVTPENPPNIPMREFYAEGFGGYADYRDDMVRWVRAVTKIDRSKP